MRQNHERIRVHVRLSDMQPLRGIMTSSGGVHEAQEAQHHSQHLVFWQDHLCWSQQVPACIVFLVTILMLLIQQNFTLLCSIVLFVLFVFVYIFLYLLY